MSLRKDHVRSLVHGKLLTAEKVLVFRYLTRRGIHVTHIWFRNVQALHYQQQIVICERKNISPCYVWLSVKAGMGESRNRMRGMMGTWGNQGGKTGNQNGNAGNQDENEGNRGWECCECGKSGWECREWVWEWGKSGWKCEE